MNVELHVEALVLHGFSPGDRHRIGAAFRSELARLLAEQGAPRAVDGGFDAPRLDGGSFQMTPHATPRAVGADVARAVYRGLSG